MVNINNSSCLESLNPLQRMRYTLTALLTRGSSALLAHVMAGP